MHSVLVCLSSFLLCSLVMSSFCITTVHGKGRANYVEGNITSLMVSATSCSTPPGLGNYSMKITRPYGPCTSNNVNYTIDHLAVLNNDEIRVRFIQNGSSNGSKNPLESKSTFSIQKGLIVGSLDYIVYVGLGTPMVQQKVIFDTGSTLSWVQCSPYCTTATCHSQTDSFYDPFRSTTYGSYSCNSPSCLQLDHYGCEQTKYCTFYVGYGDNTATTGYLSADTLALTSTDVTTDFIFGCAKADQSKTLGLVSGLFGLGRDNLSMISQLSPTHGRVFSYCLPMSDSSTGFFNFGPLQTPGTIYYTPMLPSPAHSTFYGIGLTGISVGGQMLNIPTSIFSTPGTILDSGTLFSYLPSTAYAYLRSAFQSGMTGYTRIASPSTALDTCYDFTGITSVSVPGVSLYIGSIELKLAFRSIMYQVGTTSASLYCLAFAGKTSASGVGIIGNYQQKTFEIIHDLNYQRIGFAAGRC